MHRQEVLKWNGWGYKDSFFTFDQKTQVFSFTGQRYRIGSKKLPLFKDWVQKSLGIELDTNFTSQPELRDQDIPVPIANQLFIEEFQLTGIKSTTDGQDRLFRGHGHTLSEIFTLREGRFPRIPDLVVWPKCTQDVIQIVNLADKHHVVVIPFGGGTSVTGAVTCPSDETRMIVSLDSSQMNKALSIDHENLTARFEAGIGELNH